MTHPVRFVKRLWKRLVAWFEAHPHTGWYLAAWNAANTLLIALDLLQ